MHFKKYIALKYRLFCAFLIISSCDQSPNISNKEKYLNNTIEKHLLQLRATIAKEINNGRDFKKENGITSNLSLVGKFYVNTLFIRTKVGPKADSDIAFTFHSGNTKNSVRFLDFNGTISLPRADAIDSSVDTISFVGQQ